MQHHKARTRSARVRRAGILLALAGLAVAALAMFPSGASAGAQPISLTVNATGNGDGTISGTADTSAGIVNINCSKNGGIILGCGQTSLADNEGQVVVSLTATPGATSEFTGWSVSGGGYFTDECGQHVQCDITIYQAGATGDRLRGLLVHAGRLPADGQPDRKCSFERLGVLEPARDLV